MLDFELPTSISIGLKCWAAQSVFFGDFRWNPKQSDACFRCHRTGLCANAYRGYSVFSDINECLLYPSICGEPAKCVNTPGMYECQCPDGFDYDFTGKTCDGRAVLLLSQTLCVFQLNDGALDEKPVAVSFSFPSSVMICFRCGRVWDQRVRRDLYKHNRELRVPLRRASRFPLGRGRPKLWKNSCLLRALRPQARRDALPRGAVCRPPRHLPSLPAAREHKVRIEIMIM